MQKMEEPLSDKLKLKEIKWKNLYQLKRREKSKNGGISVT